MKKQYKVLTENVVTGLYLGPLHLEKVLSAGYFRWILQKMGLPGQKLLREKTQAHLTIVGQYPIDNSNCLNIRLALKRN